MYTQGSQLGDKLKLNYTTYGHMFMEIDWGGKFNLTSCGCPMANWQGHGTHPTGHNTSEVDWGGHDPKTNHMNESLLSEVDWGAHDSSVFLFLLNIDYDANQMSHLSKDYGKNYNIELPPFLSLGSKLILWLLDKLEMIFSTPHQLPQT